MAKHFSETKGEISKEFYRKKREENLRIEQNTDMPTLFDGDDVDFEGTETDDDE
jgi:hypothetical protein